MTMLRFTELLLSVACTLPLLFVNGFQALQPTIKHYSLQKDAMIRGLLVPRQFFCPSGFGLCESMFCCQINWVCCRNGGCCQPGTNCVIGSNGVPGCCPDGKICFGPAPPGPTNNPPPPPPSPTHTNPPPPPPPPPPSPTHTTNPPPPPPPPPSPTHTNPPPPPPSPTNPNPSPPPTIISPPNPSPPPPPPSSTIISNSSSTTTLTTLLGSPTPSVQNQIINVSVVDVNIQWSENWVLQTSSCNPSIQSKITSTENSSFTYMSKDIDTSLGYFYYINVVNFNTEWEVFVDGVSQNIYFSNSSGFTNCTYIKSSNMIHTQVNISENITVVVHGSETESQDSQTLDRLSLSTPANPWSLEVNMLLIQEQNSSSGSANTTTSTRSSFTAESTVATAAPTTTTSAAGRTQPYRLLLPVVTGTSIVLAAVISILRF